MNVSQTFFTRIKIFLISEFLKSTSNKIDINKLLVILLFITSCNVVDLFAQSQVFISEKWSGTGGITAMYHHNVSKTDDQQNVYVAGSTINSTGHHDIIIQKFNGSGDLLWEQTYTGLADLDDMAADLFIDDQYNVYVTGTTTEYIQSGYDLCVLKYNSHGTLQWKYRYDNGASPLPYEAGTAITGDNDGSIFVTGGSLGDTTMSDFITIRLNTSNGNEAWKKRYDYAELNDIAAKIAIKEGRLVVAGASQITTSPEKWELATLTYAISNGNLINENRTSGSTTDGVDEIYDITVDDDYIYVAGAVNNISTGFDIRIYKLDNELNIVWEEDFDGYEEADKAHGIKVDTEGNVYVTGYVTNPSQGRNYITLKYDSNGVLIWKREFNGQDNADDEAVQLVLDENNRIFITGKLQKNGYTNYVTLGYYSNGDIFGQAIFYSPSGLNDKPAAITIDLNGDLIVTGQCEQTSGGLRTYTVKYKVYDKPFNPVIIDSVPSHNANELLVWFASDLLSAEKVNNRQFQAGELNEFVKSSIISAMSASTGIDFDKSIAFKVKRSMTIADSLSETRLGDTLRLEDYWAILSIILPDTANLTDVRDTLLTLYPDIKMVDLNSLYQLYAPNDNYYSNYQTGLHSEIHGIEMEEAWEIQKGEQIARIGIYDTGILASHQDFGGGTSEGSVIAGGHDYTFFGDSQFIDPVGHGTYIAGIIGAIRNNNDGIAGIAGKDVNDINGGCRVYDMRIVGWDGAPASMAVIFDALTHGAFGPSASGWSFTHQNLSWGRHINQLPFPDNNYLQTAIRNSFRHNVSVIVASGNHGTDPDPTVPSYPAAYTNEWVMAVGANDGSGDRAGISAYGNHIDFIAPGAQNIVYSLGNQSTSTYLARGTATSWAAPHVTGVAALMYSEHHITNGYPNNLAPEDIEQILKKTATSIGNSPNEEVGWGRINAGQALNNLALPNHYVLHLGGTPEGGNPSVSVSNNHTIFLTQQFNSLPVGSYTANLHEKVQTYVYELPEGHSVIDSWPRYASSTGISDFEVVNFQQNLEYQINTDGNTATVTARTWSWYIPGFNTWVSTTPGSLRSAISLHIQTDSFTSIDENTTDNFLTLFPNPTGGENVQVVFSAKNAGVGEFCIQDVSGRVIYRKTNSILPGANYILMDYPELSSGMYVLSAKLEDKHYNKKFIVK